jgi:hypothetical protein
MFIAVQTRPQQSTANGSQLGSLSCVPALCSSDAGFRAGRQNGPTCADDHRTKTSFLPDLVLIRRGW